MVRLPPSSHIMPFSKKSLRLSHGPESDKDRFGIGVIGRIFAKVAENDAPAGVDDEHPRQLPDIADGHADRVALGHGG